MINLSNKAAKRFRVKWSSLGERSGDFWKVDVQMIGRVPMLFIVHEHTLFTLVRRKTQFKDPLDIAGEIIRACPWYRYEGAPSLGRNGSREITGSINEMKRMTWGGYSPEQINALEMYINNCLYSYLSADKNGYDRPFRAVESLGLRSASYDPTRCERQDPLVVIPAPRDDTASVVSWINPNQMAYRNIFI